MWKRWDEEPVLKSRKHLFLNALSYIILNRANIKKREENKMGVYIFLDIMPNHISEESWESVYEESLALINAYPFMDKFIDEHTFDSTWVYVDRAGETELDYPPGKPQTGWHVFGDLKSMMTAESFELVKDLGYYQGKSRVDDEYDDILAEQIFHATDSYEDFQKRQFDDVRVFDGKTQGYPHHIYMLAIACLIESRFPGHAIVYGDISIGQMEKAVAWANSILKSPIHITERTDNKKLLKRINKIIKDDAIALEAFMRLTYHDEDFKLGEFVREHFNAETITAYYTKCFSRYEPEQIGFRSDLLEFINQGYSLETACDICVLDPDGCSYDSEAFIKAVLSMEWRTEEANPREDLPFYKDAHSEEPDTVSSQFGNVFMQMAGIQDSVKSKLTYREVAAILQEKLARPVQIEDKIKEEEEMDEEIDALMKELGLDDNSKASESEAITYEIDDLDDLLQWERGDTVHPELEKSLGAMKDFVEGSMERNKEYYTKFQSFDERKKMNFLVKSNRFFYISKQAWDQMMNNMHDPQLTHANFAILTIKSDELNTNKLCKALVNNQELLKEYIL